MKRYDGESWFLQLDSHHRFADGWDEKVIAQARRTGSTRPIVTTYAAPFDPGAPERRSLEPMQMNFDRFTPEGIALFRPGVMRDRERRDRPQPARFISAHFFFTTGGFVRDVPYDPDLYFIGEEITLTVRAFTHGYDLFHPTEAIVWHEYTREHRGHKHWTDHLLDNGVPLAWYERDRASLEKVRRFLDAPDVGPYGLGRSRTFADYEAYAGLHFGRRRAQAYTRQGLDPPNPPAAEGWAERIKSYSLALPLEKSRLPAGVDDYRFWYVGILDAAEQEIFRLDADRAEIDALLGGGGPTATVHRTFESDRDPLSWVVWPVSESRGWLERIEGRIAAGALIDGESPG
jgi:hypothetical protein